MRDRRQPSGRELVEVRFALLVERRDTFLRFGSVVEQFYGMKGEVADTPDVVGIGIEGPLGERNRGWRPLCQLVCPVLHGRVELRSRNDLVDETHLARLLRGVAIIDEPDFAGFLVADMPRQEGCTPARIDRSDLGTNLAELCGIGRNGEVAERREHVAAADGEKK